MSSAYGGPGKYIQKAGLLAELPQHVRPLGRHALCLIDRALHDRLRAGLVAAFEEAGIVSRIEIFGGECCEEEIERLAAIAEREGAEVLIGIGGGKTADTAKFVADRLDRRIVIVPTIASTDAPCSAVAVRYTAEGVYQESAHLARNPDLVLADTDIILGAPVRFLISGIGDALSTWFEARSNLESRTANYIAGGHSPTRAGIAIARACHEVLMRDARPAVMAATRGLRTTAVDTIIEANILLSGLGFENCGCSAAHGIHNGLTALHETHRFFHGEKVAFGTLCLLVLEDRAETEVREMIAFCQDLGLPTMLADLGIVSPSRETIEQVAALALAPGECTFATPVVLSVQAVTDAILALDALATSMSKDR